MIRYAGYSKLKKMALMVVAHKSSSEEIGILRKIFQKYDVNSIALLRSMIALDTFKMTMKQIMREKS